MQNKLAQVTISFWGRNDSGIMAEPNSIIIYKLLAHADIVNARNIKYLWPMARIFEAGLWVMFLNHTSTFITTKSEKCIPILLLPVLILLLGQPELLAN